MRCLLLLTVLLVTAAPAPAAHDPFIDPPAGDEGLLSWFGAMGADQSEGYFSDAKGLYDQGNYDGAAILFGRLVGMSPSHSRDAHKMVCRCHVARDDVDRAGAWLDSYARRFGHDADTFALVGMRHDLLGDSAKAVDAYQSSLKLAPDVAAVHFRLALAYDGLDQPNRTVEHCQRAVQLDPSYKKRLQPLIKNSNVARRIGAIVNDVIKQTEHCPLTDDEIDQYARRVGEILGQEPVVHKRSSGAVPGPLPPVHLQSQPRTWQTTGLRDTLRRIRERQQMTTPSN